MDRREALKKLAAGSAIAFASPLIVKSTAFADTGTVSCQPSPFDANVGVIGGSIAMTAFAGPPSYAQVRVNTGSVAYERIACPGGPLTRADAFHWTVTGPGPGTPVVLNGGGGGPITGTWTTQFRVRIATAGGSGSLLDSGLYTVTTRFRVTCTVGTRTCWRCATFTSTFTWIAATSSFDLLAPPSSVGAATPENCNV